MPGPPVGTTARTPACHSANGHTSAIQCPGRDASTGSSTTAPGSTSSSSSRLVVLFTQFAKLATASSVRSPPGPLWVSSGDPPARRERRCNWSMTEVAITGPW